MPVRRILTINSHEPWIYQLRHVDAEVDIIDGLPGRPTQSWDTRMRPVPRNASLITLEEAMSNGVSRHQLALAHNISDLRCLERVDAPKLLVLHVSLEHRARCERSATDPRAFAAAADAYLQQIGAHAVGGTPFKARSWKLTKDALGLALDSAEFAPWGGEIARGLRVANQIHQKRETLLWDFHEEAFRGVPVTIAGRNPEIAGAEPSRDYEHLKELYRSHRFLIHTAHPDLEDGYNMASVEAMGAGMPIIGNRHPTQIAEHGVSGFLSDDPRELRGFAELLLEDRALAAGMGAAARRRAAECFPVARFVASFERAWAAARAARRARRPAISHLI